MKKVYIDDEGRIFEDEIADLIMELEGLNKESNTLKGFRIWKDKDSNNKKSKGENIMNKLFNKSNKGKVIRINKEDGTIKRKAKVIKEIAAMGVKGTLKDPWTYAAGGSVGLQQGLKYRGDFKAGGKAGLATVAVLAGVDVAVNIIGNMDVIKEA